MRQAKETYPVYGRPPEVDETICSAAQSLLTDANLKRLTIMEYMWYVRELAKLFRNPGRPGPGLPHRDGDEEVAGVRPRAQHDAVPRVRDSTTSLRPGRARTMDKVPRRSEQKTKSEVRMTNQTRNPKSQSPDSSVQRMTKQAAKRARNEGQGQRTKQNERPSSKPDARMAKSERRTASQIPPIPMTTTGSPSRLLMGGTMDFTQPVDLARRVGRASRRYAATSNTAGTRRAGRRRARTGPAVRAGDGLEGDAAGSRAPGARKDSTSCRTSSGTT